MAMTYLQLAQRLRQEVGVAGTGPTTVVGQTGELKRLCDWVATAYNDICTIHEDWFFLRNTFSFDTVSQQATYAPSASPVSLTDFGSWKLDSIRISTTASAYADEQLTVLMDYDTWRNMYQYGSMRTTYSRPVSIAVAPDKKLCLGPSPDSTGYTVNGEYYRTPNVLAADIDAHYLPTRYEMIVVYRAMMLYGSYEAAPEVYAMGENEYRKLLGRMEVDQIKTPTFGPPMA